MTSLPQTTKRRLRAAASSSGVKIDIGGNCAFIHGLPADFLHAELSYVENVITAGGPGGCQVVQTERRLYRCESRNQILIGAGHVPRVVRLCAQQNIPVQVSDHRQDPPRCRWVNDQLFGKLNADDEDLLRAVRDAHQGQLVVQNHHQLARTIALICRLFPKARVLIPVASIDKARQLGAALDDALGGGVSLARGLNWQWSTKHVVCTYYSAWAAIPENTDIIIFADVPTMRSEMAVRAFQDMVDQRRYAVVTSDLVLGRSHALRLEFACGPVIYTSMPRDGLPAQVNVLLCTATPLAPTTKAANALARKRADYWFNCARNRLIAEIAQAFHVGDIQPLWQHGLLLNTDQLQPQRVAVLVESAEHACQIQELLPQWPLLTALPGSAMGWHVLMDRCVVTQAYANNLPSCDTEVLINAIGGDWIPEISGFPPRFKDPNRTVSLVDFADDATNRQEQATRRRIAAYRQRNWPISAPPQWLTTAPADLTR